MKPQIVGIDAQSALGLAGKTRNRDTRTQHLFDSLLAQISASRTDQAGTVPASSNETTAKTTASDPLPSNQTPLAMLQQGLADNGISMERMQIPASDRSRLEEVLVNCGYKEEDAKQILDKASNSDGSINLGMVFTLLPKYVPQQGPQFFIKAEDKPLLSQVLKGLGVPTEEINRFMEGLEQVGDRLRVTGLPALLAKAGSLTGEKAGQVDRAVLSDLLTKMGLSTDEVNTLLAKAYDSQGRANPKAVLALLQSAANRQDQATTETLKDLAQRIKVAPEDQKKPLDAERLRAQFIQAVHDVESGLQAKHGEFAKDLSDALAALSKGMGESKLVDLLSRSVTTEGGEQTAQPAQNAAQPVAGRAAEGLAGSSAQSNLAGGFQRQGGEQGQSFSPGRSAQSQGVGAFGAAMGRADQAEAGQASGPRGVLPAYVVRQVGQAMTQMVAKEQTTLRLELKPPSLGELNLELAVKDGVVTAKMVAESAAAKQALEAGLDQLKTDLANQGLKVSQVEITINPDAERGQAQAQARGEGDPGGRGSSPFGGGDYLSSGAGDDEDLLVTQYSTRTGGARISVFA